MKFISKLHSINMRKLDIFLNFFQNIIVKLIVILIKLLDIFFRYPEIYFALFLIAGVYKADPRLYLISRYLDLTIFFEILTVLSVFYNILLKKINLFLPPKQVFLPYILLIFLAILSLLYTPSPLYGSDKLFRFLFITSMSFIFPLLIFKDKDSYVRFLVIFITLALIMGFDIITGGLKPGEFSFHEALGANYLAVGRISGIAVLSIITLIFVLKKKIQKILLFLIILFPIFNILIAGGRGPLLSLAISILILFIYLGLHSFKLLKRDILIKKSYLNITLVLFLLIFISFLLIIFYKDFFVTTIYRLSLLENLEGSSIETRISMYRTAVVSLYNFPCNMIGVGIGGFSYIYNRSDMRLYPHNIFLEILSELGVLGMFLFTFMILFSLKLALNNIKETNNVNYYLNLGILLNFIFMFFNSQFSGDINDNRLLFTFLGSIYAFRRITKNDKENLSHNHSTSSI
jgi:O-antigen ligase